jgi:hypothetical protein
MYVAGVSVPARAPSPHVPPLLENKKYPFASLLQGPGALWLNGSAAGLAPLACFPN